MAWPLPGILPSAVAAATAFCQPRAIDGKGQIAAGIAGHDLLSGDLSVEPGTTGPVGLDKAFIHEGPIALKPCNLARGKNDRKETAAIGHTETP